MNAQVIQVSYLVAGVIRIKKNFWKLCFFFLILTQEYVSIDF